VKRIAALVVGLMVVVSACEPGRPPRTVETTEPQVRSPRPRCGVIDTASRAYEWSLHPRVASPGERVTIAGPTLRSEAGRWTPARRMEFWFNTKTPPTESPDASPLAPGPIVPLATVGDLRRCVFEISFTVPHVPPGRYRIAGFVYEQEDLGFLLSHVLTVT
jgi:hypothetical protein